MFAIENSNQVNLFLFFEENQMRHWPAKNNYITDRNLNNERFSQIKARWSTDSPNLIKWTEAKDFVNKQSLPLSLEAFCLYRQWADFEELYDKKKCILYSSGLSPSIILDAANKYSSKVNAINLCKSIDSKFLNPKIEVIERRNLEVVLSRWCPPFVVKSEYSAGGRGSAIITSEPIAELFINYINELDIRLLERPNLDRFIVEEFLVPILQPSMAFYISDGNIKQIYDHDRITSGVQYISSSSPSKSKRKIHIHEFCMNLCHQIKKNGFRGPVDFEFIETAQRIVFNELNARYPISIFRAFSKGANKPYNFIPKQKSIGIFRL